jgi:uncharacterized membrane protein SpoIIM required for sporulation
MKEATPRSVSFRREREAAWRELDRLVKQADRRGLRSLSAAETARLPSLHRAACSALSVARAISLDRNLLDYLESLTARSFACVYAPRRRVLDAVAELLSRRFPATVRALLGPLALSVLCMLGGVAAGYALTSADPERYFSFVSESLAQGRDPGASTESLRAALHHAPNNAAETLSAFASFLFTHNAQVAILCFALGFVAGIPVVLLLLQNGMILGAMAALYAGRGLGSEFWAWVLPHGITELGAIALCGAAGLRLGQAVVFPGRLSRLENLAARGREMSVVLAGCVAMLFVAALFEGYFRQLVQDVPTRWSVAAFVAVGWGLYFTLFGRGRAT